MNVEPSPNISIAGPTAAICFPTQVNLSASGANAYTWQPGNNTTSTIFVTAAVSTNYSITGSIGNCTATVTRSVQVLPNVTLAVGNSAAGTVCPETSVTIAVTSSNNYTIEPGHIINSGTVVKPGKTQTYTVTGTNGFCQKSAITTVSVFPDFELFASVSSSTPCMGDTVVFSLFGADFYTVQPGNLTGSVVIDVPVIPQTYTVIGETQNFCRHDTLITVTPLECVQDGIQMLSAPVARVYPNPGNEWVNVIVRTSGVQVELIAINGEVVRQWSLSEQNSILKLNGCSPGVYLLKIVERDHPPAFSKLIIE